MSGDARYEDLHTIDYEVCVYIALGTCNLSEGIVNVDKPNGS